MNRKRMRFQRMQMTSSDNGSWLTARRKKMMNKKKEEEEKKKKEIQLYILSTNFINWYLLMNL